MSKLAASIEYCQVKVGKKNYQVLVVNGIPFEYRMFCSLMICKLGGDIVLNLRATLNYQINEFWHTIGYIPAGDPVLYAHLSSWQALQDFSAAIAKVNGNTDDVFESADYLELMKSVSRMMHEEKQLRLADVNNDRLIA